MPYLVAQSKLDNVTDLVTLDEHDEPPLIPDYTTSLLSVIITVIVDN